MRPKSIVWFERLFFACLGISGLNVILGFDEAVAKLRADPATAELGSAEGFAVAIFVFTLAIQVVLWFFIARRGSNIAKWILVIMTVGGFLMIGANPAEMLALAHVGSLIAALLQIAAIAFLFRSDARAWLSRARLSPTL